MKLTPRSAAASRIRRAVGSSLWPAKVIVPRQISDTFKPVRPSRRWFMDAPVVRHDPTVPTRTRLQVTRMADPKSAPAPAHDPRYGHPHGWRFLLMADLTEQAIERPWGSAVMAVGLVHLAFFLACQAVYT